MAALGHRAIKIGMADIRREAVMLKSCLTVFQNG
jgi:hypothetical protein